MNPTIRELLQNINRLGQELEDGGGQQETGSNAVNENMHPLSTTAAGAGGLGAVLLIEDQIIDLGARKQPSKNKSDSGPFVKDVVLLAGPDESIVPRQSARVFLMEKNLIVAGAQFLKEFDNKQLLQKVRNLFPSILKDGDELEILMPVYFKLLPPNLPPGQLLNGCMVTKIFKDKPLYIRPSRQLIYDNAAEPTTKKRNLDADAMNIFDISDSNSETEDMPLFPPVASNASYLDQTDSATVQCPCCLLMYPKVPIEVNTDTESFNVALEALDGELEFAGYNNLSPKLSDKDSIIQHICQHYIINCCRNEIESFTTGLQFAGVLDICKMFPEDAARELCYNEKPVSAAEVKSLFTAIFSAKDKVERKRVICPKLFADEVDKLFTLEDIMQFATGSRGVPVTGYEHTGCIEFNHDASKGRCLNANTCAIPLVFPTNERYCSSLDSFAENIVEDILNRPTFGMV
eukprot:gene16371-18013_t